MTSWQPIETAIRDGKTPVSVRMPFYNIDKPTHYWEGVAILYPEPEEDHWTHGESILHYNGNVLVPGFRGPFTHWKPLTQIEDEEGI